MRFFLSLFSIFFLSLYTLEAQTVTVSDEINVRNENSYEIFGKLEDKFLVYIESSNKVKIQAFNKKLRKSWDKELAFDEKRFEIKAVIPQDTSFTLLYHYRKKGINYYKSHTYDGAANLTDSLTLFSQKHSFGDPEFEVVLSEDKSKALLYSVRNQSTFSLMLYDMDEKQIRWSETVSMKDNRFFKEYQEIIVSNEGEAFLIAGKENRKNKIENHRFLIYRKSPYLNTIDRFEVNMQQHLTFTIKFEYDNRNKNLVAGGLYSTKTLSRADGYFSLLIPSAKPSSYMLTFDTFSAEAINDLEGKIMQNFKGLEYVSIQDIVLRRDGGMLLFFEKVRAFERRLATTGRAISASSGLRYIVDYNYDNVLVIAVHPDGEKHWERVLHKKQYSQDDLASYSSYFIFKTPSQLRLIFNDDIKNENTVSEYLLNSLGAYDRNSVLSTESQNIKLRFRDAKQISAKEVLVASENRGKLKLVSVSF